ncbi:hypothetical protein EV356DRAFT_569960 [Viridothelium virens]|uniref:Subtilisin-like serine protease n=1 Tax=Viridothelium virens TaxID=1048519 RepID=A0A6A6GYP7_VIRVR|nr:hypothetical protein EV356DRAFT_569960 [Viridothelium virens]
MAWVALQTFPLDCRAMYPPCRTDEEGLVLSVTVLSILINITECTFLILMKMQQPTFCDHLNFNKYQPSPTSFPPSSLPGFPCLLIRDVSVLSQFFNQELWCKDLDQISRYLWMMSSQSSANISALHHQRVKGREVILTEDPKLHLIWRYDRIYLKPVPEYLLCPHIWKSVLLNPEALLEDKRDIVCTSALGFLRTYAYLIRHESDLRIAKTRELIPPFVTWHQWCLLRMDLLKIEDSEVSPRYRFGEIRLTRLNFYVKILLRKSHYHRVHQQYGEYFASFYAPILFIFGVVSATLSSMQLVATVEQIDQRWSFLTGLFRGFSITIIVITFLLMCALLILLLVKIVAEWRHALRVRLYQKDKDAWTKPYES